MEAIKSVSQEPVRRQVEILSATSSVSDTKKGNSEKIDKEKKEAQNYLQFNETANEKINRIAEAMENYVQSIQRDLKIQVHEETGNIMVRVTSHESGKIIREIPPKELLDLAARMEELAGALFDEKV
ncbi:MAG: flagellar protein FlaG [Deltaproteobacteria bacterium]|nr:flagellar protein FlaG [Deltaproteobacteria bacterium]